MARPRAFDLDLAVERAMGLFWRQGYEATSLADLTRELGIGQGSLYAAFGSKDGLYAAALGRYCSSHAAGLVALLEDAAELRPVLWTALRAMAEADAGDPDRGCLLVNAAIERADDPATADTVTATMRQVESALAGALERARARGELSADKDPIALARFLTTFVQGLRVMGKARAAPPVIDDALEVALASLD